MSQNQNKLSIKGARVNNLKDIDVEIPKNKLVVITGLSGSGKSSLAFDTIFAEGQRRYVESLGSSARQFLELQNKPDVDEIKGLSPTIAIEQKGLSENPRSTVATITEIADYLRLLFARAGRMRCLSCGVELSRMSAEEIVRRLQEKMTTEPWRVLAPLIRHSPLRHSDPERAKRVEGEESRGKKDGVHSSPSAPQDDERHDDLLARLERAGFTDVRLNGEMAPLPSLKENGLPSSPFSLEVVLGTYGPKEIPEDSEHVRLQILTALELGDGSVMAERAPSSPQPSPAPHPRPLPRGEGELSALPRFEGEGQGEGICFFSKDLTCPKCGKTYPPLEPRNFSFNSPHGACGECAGLGVKSVVIPELVMPNPRLTLKEGAIKPWTRVGANQTLRIELLAEVAKRHNFSLDTPVGKLSDRACKIILYGDGAEKYELKGTLAAFPGVIPELQARYAETDSDYIRKEIESYMRQEICSACGGARLNEEARAVTFAGKNIAELLALSVEEAIGFFSALNHPQHSENPVLNLPKESRANGARHASARDLPAGKAGSSSPLAPQNDKNRELTNSESIIASPIVKEIITRLEHLNRAGLYYLTLDRPAPALSGGEGQRVRLAIQLSTTLSGVIYILDEPTVGLHERDTAMLLDLLKKLLEHNNTVIVVEHDSGVMRQADLIIDMGPGAGAQGGEIVAQGTPSAIVKNRASLTGAYLAGRKRISRPAPLPSPAGKGGLSMSARPLGEGGLPAQAGRRPGEGRKSNGKYLSIKEAAAFNLKNIDVKIPLGLFVVVSGVSGSGKSTLILDILAKALARKLYGANDLPLAHKDISGMQFIDKVITVDQTPIGRTPRSNPATYTGIFSIIRDLYTEVPESKLKGFDAGTFSFNVKGGRCEACAGEGYIKIPMQFMTETFIVCSECAGTRYRAQALEIHYKGKNIAEVLKMSAAEAKEFFSETPLLAEKLQVLEDVGLGYIRLGQPAPTLSGGEAQRVKLATELSRRATGKTLYILDEPTTGLHFQDIQHLLDVLHRLVDKGNTVLVIEHNLDVIKTADFVIDLGPEGGDKGGEIVAQGTPQDICKAKRSYTGQYLKKILPTKRLAGRA